jgi:5-methylcytosine-specific restriction endonuclease McrA
MMKRIGDRPLTPAERQRRYRERHAERVKESQQRWLEANPERRKEVARNFYQRNKKSENARAMKWRAENPDAARKHRMDSHYRNYESDILRMAARRAKARAFLITAKDSRRIMSQPCAECGAGENLHLDHIVPISRGGLHSVGNLQMLCQRCNLSKNSQLTVEWRAKRLVAA